MKRFYYYVMSLAFLCALTACSEDDEPTSVPPSSKGVEAVNKIVEVLEKEHKEVSDFVEVLKKVDVTNLEEDKLTVFAVRNATAPTRASGAVLDSASIQRHIAKGSYKELTNVKGLECINGDSLRVTRSADGSVYVNGVIIEGNSIAAGNSYIFIVPEVLAELPDTPVTPETDLAEIEEEWDAVTKEYFEGILSLERILITGSDPEAFTSDETLKFYSDSFWKLAYETLEKGVEYRKRLDSMTKDAADLLIDINVDMAIIRCHLYGYYGKLLNGGTQIPPEQLIEDLKKSIDAYPSQAKHAMSLLLAKIYADKGDWNDASEYCKRIENGSYQLTSLWSPTEKEALWSGYEYISEDGNEVRMPLPLLREVYLFAAIANSKLGNLPESMAYIDRLTKGFFEGKEYDTTDGSLASLARTLLQGNGGQLYPYYRILKIALPVTGAQDKHHYLPIPQKVLDENPEIIQNPGY